MQALPAQPWAHQLLLLLPQAPLQGPGEPPVLPQSPQLLQMLPGQLLPQLLLPS
jgi:hypothetical protein